MSPNINIFMSNASLEPVALSWKKGLATHDISVGGSEPLTSARYADDLLLSAKP